MRIGGEFEIRGQSLAKACAKSHPSQCGAYELWVNTGRSALLLALKEIVRQEGLKEAWLPAYICPSVIAPFVDQGFALHFYSTGGITENRQSPPLPEIGGTVLLVHYFGRKNDAVVKWVREQRKTRRFFVIEDCVQASLNSNVGETGDFVITSYRKFLPQPDGALLSSRTEIHCELEEPDEAFVSAKLIGKLLRQTSRQETHYLQLLEDAEQKLGMLQPRKMSWLSSYMLQRTDVGRIAQIRRRNWRRLNKCLVDRGLLAHLSPLFDTLADGEVPLGLPVQVKEGKRDGLRRFLFAHEIYCPVHWQLEHLETISQNYLQEIALSHNIITLPIDQRLGGKQLDYMVEAISVYFSNSGKI
ncbi:MAG: DegT/DnrJ/EryC1/StrS family aminotransferase [Rhodocyclaceae bacterium]|nr:DegT/DnrJ/EryC1/StrS family aminotransferase [Rhodocyclaceae bacterium]